MSTEQGSAERPVPTRSSWEVRSLNRWRRSRRGRPSNPAGTLCVSRGRSEPILDRTHRPGRARCVLGCSLVPPDLQPWAVQTHTIDPVGGPPSVSPGTTCRARSSPKETADSRAGSRPGNSLSRSLENDRKQALPRGFRKGPKGAEISSFGYNTGPPMTPQERV